MKEEFYVVLPSNSSMSYYPDNLTTRYTTQLPQRVNLHGSWAVALVEIQIPMTILHIPPEGDQNFFHITSNAVPGGKAATDFDETRASVPPGVYRSIDALLETINELSCVAGHLKFHCQRNGVVAVTRICRDCHHVEHAFHFSTVLNKILGFTHSSSMVVKEGVIYAGQRPASLTNGIPDMFFVYTDISESYITGDVHTPLLRVVPFAATDNYNYGSVKIKSFSPPRYVPLLRTSFQTITIDIRDEFGEPIPFEYGTLTVTLQFKRTD